MKINNNKTRKRNPKLKKNQKMRRRLFQIPSQKTMDTIEGTLNLICKKTRAMIKQCLDLSLNTVIRRVKRNFGT